MDTVKRIFWGSKRRMTLSVLALVLLLSILFCTLLLPFLQSGPIVMTCKGTYLRQGTFMYLYTFFRYLLLSQTNAVDTPAFWQKVRPDGMTNNQYYGEMAVLRVEHTFASARLYDQYATLSAEERQHLSLAEKDMIADTRVGGGSKKAFREQAKAFGFSYRDFSEATTLLYKAAHLRDEVYGATGAKLTVEQMDAFLSEQYVHVKMILVRTEGSYDNFGNFTAFTDEQKAEQQTKLKNLRASLVDEMNDTEFAKLFLAYNEDKTTLNGQRYGSYYFSAGSTYTKEYRASLPDVAESVFSLPMGQWDEVSTPYGVYFLMRCAPQSGVYSDKLYQEFFFNREINEFNAHLMQHLFSELLSEKLENVKIKRQKWIDSLDFATTPSNTKLYIYDFKWYEIEKLPAL